MTPLLTIADIICEAYSINREELTNRHRSPRYCNARGIFLLMAREEGFTQQVAAAFIKRSRSACTITANRYRYYVYYDKKLREMYHRIRNIIRNK